MLARATGVNAPTMSGFGTKPRLADIVRCAIGEAGRGPQSGFREVLRGPDFFVKNLDGGGAMHFRGRRGSRANP